MIDYFALALGHGLLAYAFLRLVQRDELDVDPILEQAKQLKRAKDKARHKRSREVEDQT